MSKNDDTVFIRNELMKVPLEERKSWNEETSLFAWWLEVKEGNSFSYCPTMSDWKKIPGICNDLIGERAVF